MKRRFIKRFLKIIPLILLVGVLATQIISVSAQTPIPENKVYIYLFYGEGCPHCGKAKPYLESLAATYPQVELVSYEVYYDTENQVLFGKMARAYNITSFGVPTIFIGDRYIQGYAEELNSAFESVVQNCIQNSCVDLGEGIIKNVPVDTATPIISVTPSAIPESEITPEPTTNAEVPTTDQPENLNDLHEITLPLLGRIDLESKSTFLSTLLIALVDGFNPCSLWVLTMLLALTLHTGSRRKVFVIGIIFLTVTALIYALFIAGLFSVLKITSFLPWIRVLVALIALVFALVNIKDYLWYKQGLSFTISEEKKPGIFKQMRKVLDASNSIASLAGATVVLAAGVSLVEFSCTAGFPVVWTNILTSQNVNAATFALLLLLYMVIYQIDELLIFSTAVITLKASRLEEKHGRLLKLISGTLMFTLAVVMIVKPTLLNDLSSSLVIFIIAGIITVVIHLVQSVVLPKLGIRIGSLPERYDKK